jgi:hypothetical protein
VTGGPIDIVLWFYYFSIFLNILDLIISIFLELTPYSPFKINWTFERTCRIHLYGRTINQARNQC